MGSVRGNETKLSQIKKERCSRDLSTRHVMKEKYLNIKKDNNELLVVIKNGKFYYVYGEDIYIIYYFFNYKIKDNILCFPDININKITKKLKEYNIGYIVFESSINKEYGDSLYYFKYIELGKGKYIKDNLINEIIIKLNNKSINELNKIKNII